MSGLINSLTRDEDLRQELWVHYLTGNDVSTFSSHLEQLSKQSLEPVHLQENIHALLTDPFSLELVEVLNGFSALEKTVMCLLVLGYTISSISEHKGISEVRIRQLISCIRANRRWDDYLK